MMRQMWKDLLEILFMNSAQNMDSNFFSSNPNVMMKKLLNVLSGR